jgi:hypothetical protein
MNKIRTDELHNRIFTKPLNIGWHLKTDVNHIINRFVCSDLLDSLGRTFSEFSSLTVTRYHVDDSSSIAFLHEAIRKHIRETLHD